MLKGYEKLERLSINELSKSASRLNDERYNSGLDILKRLNETESKFLDLEYFLQSEIQKLIQINKIKLAIPKFGVHTSSKDYDVSILIILTLSF